MTGLSELSPVCHLFLGEWSRGTVLWSAAVGDYSVESGDDDQSFAGCDGGETVSGVAADDHSVNVGRPLFAAGCFIEHVDVAGGIAEEDFATGDDRGTVEVSGVGLCPNDAAGAEVDGLQDCLAVPGAVADARASREKRDVAVEGGCFTAVERC